MKLYHSNSHPSVKARSNKLLRFNNLKMPLTRERFESNVSDAAHWHVIERQISYQVYRAGLVVEISPTEIDRVTVTVLVRV